MIHYCTDPWQHVIHVSVLHLQIEIIVTTNQKCMCTYALMITSSLTALCWRCYIHVYQHYLSGDNPECG